MPPSTLRKPHRKGWMSLALVHALKISLSQSCASHAFMECHSRQRPECFHEYEVQSRLIHNRWATYV